MGKEHGSAPKDIDPETAAQVKEIEERLSSITLDMKKCAQKAKMCTIEAQRATLTRKQLEDVPQDATLYRSIGRMFLTSTTRDVMKSMQAQIALKTVEGQQLKQTEASLQQKIKSEAVGLREILGVERMKKMFEGGEARENLGMKDFLGYSEKDESETMMPIFGKTPQKRDAAPEDGKQKGGVSIETNE